MNKLTKVFFAFLVLIIGTGIYSSFSLRHADNEPVKAEMSLLQKENSISNDSALPAPPMAQATDENRLAKPFDFLKQLNKYSGVHTAKSLLLAAPGVVEFKKILSGRVVITAFRNLRI